MTIRQWWQRVHHVKGATHLINDLELKRRVEARLRMLEAQVALLEIRKEGQQ